MNVYTCVYVYNDYNYYTHICIYTPICTLSMYGVHILIYKYDIIVLRRTLYGNMIFIYEYII